VFPDDLQRAEDSEVEHSTPDGNGSVATR
jgi:hypothetical protein